MPMPPLAEPDTDSAAGRGLLAAPVAAEVPPITAAAGLGGQRASQGLLADICRMTPEQLILLGLLTPQQPLYRQEPPRQQQHQAVAEQQRQALEQQRQALVEQQQQRDLLQYMLQQQGLATGLGPGAHGLAAVMLVPMALPASPRMGVLPSPPCLQWQQQAAAKGQYGSSSPFVDGREPFPEASPPPVLSPVTPAATTPHTLLGWDSFVPVAQALPMVSPGARGTAYVLPHSRRVNSGPRKQPAAI